MDRTMSLVLYKEGNRKARLLSFAEAFEDYVDAFLPRLNAEITLEFVEFYRYQLYTYLRSKPVFRLSLPEGDMISDLIKDAYDTFLSDIDSSPFNIGMDGRENLLKSVRICFPWQTDPDSLPDAR